MPDHIKNITKKVEIIKMEISIKPSAKKCNSQPGAGVAKLQFQHLGGRGCQHPEFEASLVLGQWGYSEKPCL